METEAMWHALLLIQTNLMQNENKNIKTAKT